MIDELFDRNVAWATGKTRSDRDYFRRLAEQQAPRFLWLGCSDSRVPANDIVGLDPGEVFVHRNVGNVVHTGDMNLLSVLEFAVETLQVKHVIVCGHYGCGGIRRAFEPPGGGGLVDHWLAPVREMCRRCAPDLARLPNEAAKMNRACELNVGLEFSHGGKKKSFSAHLRCQAHWVSRPPPSPPQSRSVTPTRATDRNSALGCVQVPAVL